MALRAGYYGLKTKILNKVNKWDQIVFSRDEQAILGSKNLCPNTATTKTDGGVTFTVNSDGSVTLNGTANATVGFVLMGYGRWLKPGDYILNGCTGGSDSTYKLAVNKSAGDIAKCLNGDVKFSVDNTVDYRVWIVVYSGTQFNNLTIYPMIRLASDPDSTYVPYAMTNRDLTLSAADQKTAINAIITAATGAADFAAFKTAMGAITPVSRSFSIEGTTEPDSRSIPEEKTVTKKTTKKIVKEGE